MLTIFNYLLPSFKQLKKIAKTFFCDVNNIRDNRLCVATKNVQACFVEQWILHGIHDFLGVFNKQLVKLKIYDV